MRTAVFGSRLDGHAKVVVELFAQHPGLELTGLLDDHPENVGRTIGSLAVLGGCADLSRLAAEGLEAVVLGFGAARGRAAILAAVAAAELELPTLVHPTAFVAASAELGPGVQVMPQASVGPGARLGAGVLVNTGASVDHDVEIEQGSVVDPGAVLAGRVQVGAEVEIGSGAVLIPDSVVGPEAVVGAGAVVVKPVAAGETVVGVPARPLLRG
jgi:sugar O-acyltransferase (sialic acid O-acetyltransferase NeuD family)